MPDDFTLFITYITLMGFFFALVCALCAAVEHVGAVHRLADKLLRIFKLDGKWEDE